MSDPLAVRALELLRRGHNLYAGEHLDTDLADAPVRIGRHLERLIGVTTRSGMRSVVAPTLGMAAGLRNAAAADTTLAALLADAHADHVLAQHATRSAFDDAVGDSLAAADTPLGRREVLRRMAARLQAQRRYIHRSHWLSRLLALRMRRLGYLHRGPASHVRHASAAHVIPLSTVRYDKVFASGQVRGRIAAAPSHLGVTDPAARRNWLQGYETLIARESAGRPCAVGAGPAATPGPEQPDGHGLGYARGITQIIPATFARYHQPGTSTNIYDPVANICASMNYVIHRYGVRRDGANLVALVQQANMHRPPKGY